MNSREESRPRISSIKDARVAETRRRLEARTTFLVEGTGMVRHALNARAGIRNVFFLDPPPGESERELLAELSAGGDSGHLVSRGVFLKLLGLGYETAVAVLAEVQVPSVSLSSVQPAPGAAVAELYLAGENIQDPRNVGVLVRTADAFGVRAFVLSEDSAWPWSRQAVRSSTGSIFRVPILLAKELAGVLGALKARGVTVIGSSASATTECDAAACRYPCALLLGNESTGLSPSLRAVCDSVLRIPMSGGAHSLNVTVAGGILLNELSRARPGFRETAARRNRPDDRDAADEPQ